MLHDVWPLEGSAVPGLHRLQLELPGALEKEPALHFVQLDLP